MPGQSDSDEERARAARAGDHGMKSNVLKHSIVVRAQPVGTQRAKAYQAAAAAATHQAAMTWETEPKRILPRSNYSDYWDDLEQLQGQTGTTGDPTLASERSPGTHGTPSRADSRTTTERFPGTQGMTPATVRCKPHHEPRPDVGIGMPVERFAPLQRTATEHSRAGSGHSTAQSRMDPDIRLQKSMTPAAVPCKTHHSRTPDVGIGIRVFMPSLPAMTEYYGEYLGHGHAKTAFELHCPGARFHGKVLKVARKNDMETSVFTVASQFGLTTSILYNCEGVDSESGLRYHCWITDRTIPLDEFCRYDGAVKSRCSLAAFCCILRAAQYGLILSDCHFFNFGVRFTESATEHDVVIIDAGSRGIHPDTQLKKRWINTTVMHRFWKACAEESATNVEIEKMWRQAQCHKQCLAEATRKLQSLPLLTKTTCSTCAVWQAMIAKDAFNRLATQATSAYKIIEMVGRYTGEDQWSAEFALVCYRASRTMDELPSEGHEILDELYERLTYTRREDEQLHGVMVFWAKLHEFREHSIYRDRLLQSSEDQTLTPQQGAQMLENFKYYELWYDLTKEQQRRTGWRSTLNTVLHKRAGWTHAAKSILQYGLPKLERAARPDDATEHISALGQFARDLAKWLHGFASRMHAYKMTEQYQQRRKESLAALGKRKSEQGHSKQQPTRPLHARHGS